MKSVQEQWNMLKALVLNKRGQTGLEQLQQVIIGLFVIGVIVMFFVIVGVELKGSTTDTQAQTVINTTYNAISGVTDWFTLIILLGAVVVIMALLAVAIFVIRRSVGKGGA